VRKDNLEPVDPKIAKKYEINTSKYLPMDSTTVQLHLKKSLSRRDTTSHIIEAILPKELQGTQLHVAGGEIP